MNLKKYFEYAKSIGFSDIEFKTQKKSKLSIQVFHSKVEQYQVSELQWIGCGRSYDQRL